MGGGRHTVGCVIGGGVVEVEVDAVAGAGVGVEMGGVLVLRVVAIVVILLVVIVVLLVEGPAIRGGVLPPFRAGNGAKVTLFFPFSFALFCVLLTLLLLSSAIFEMLEMGNWWWRRFSRIRVYVYRWIDGQMDG